MDLETIEDSDEGHEWLVSVGQFCGAMKKLVDGGPFDLTDSPKSFVETVRSLVKELDTYHDAYLKSQGKIQ